jgi:hypothetical protein
MTLAELEELERHLLWLCREPPLEVASVKVGVVRELVAAYKERDALLEGC